MEATNQLRLHRLAQVRRAEHLSRGAMAARLGITIEEVRQQECPRSDISLSVLHAWARVLDVPAAELIAEPNSELSPQLARRATLVRAMRTTLSIRQRVKSSRLRTMVEELAELLVDIMPELQGVRAWTRGWRRPPTDLGIAYTRQLSADCFNATDDER